MKFTRNNSQRWIGLLMGIEIQVFYMKTSKRRRKNKIRGLVNSDGLWCSNSGGILNTVYDYFQNIFSSSSPSVSDFDVVLSCVKPRVTNEINNVPLRPFLGKEARKALMDMHPTKSPCPDGLPALFFQKFWNIVGLDITKVALHILNEHGDIGI